LQLQAAELERVGSLEESMQQLGQFAAAKRSIQATVERSTAEAEANLSSLSLLSARKKERDSMRAERASAVRSLYPSLPHHTVCSWSQWCLSR
jgi:hypothetical protein